MDKTLCANANLKKLESGELKFDPEIYLQPNPDVAQAGVDPFEHYLNFGIRERRRISYR